MDAPVEAGSERQDSPAPAKRRRKRRLAYRVLYLVLVLAAFTFPGLWGPPLVAHFIRGAIAKPELGGTLEAVDHVSLTSFEMHGLRFNAVPGTPTLERVSARYSLHEIIRSKRLTALHATGFRMDLAEAMPPEAAALFTNLLVEAEVHVGPAPDGGEGMYALLFGQALDWPVRGNASFAAATTNGFSLAGSARLELPDTPWFATADFGATTNGWTVDAQIPAQEPDETDPVVGAIASRLPMPGVTNLAFRGTVWANVHAEQTKALPVPAWRAAATLEDARVSLEASGMPVEIRGIQTKAAVSGLAAHWDLAPLFPMFRSAKLGDFELGPGNARLLADERSILVSEAAVGFCGGFVRVYALSFLPERLDAGFTLYLDDIDTGLFLNHLPDFHGEATGRLHGKIPLRIVEGRAVRLRDAFLYSPPGEIGKLRIDDASAITENLMASGVSAETCKNLAKALADLDYTVLRMDLRRGADDEESSLSVRLEGTATEGRKTVPVDFSVTFHGALERLLNFGLRTASGANGR